MTPDSRVSIARQGPRSFYSSSATGGLRAAGRSGATGRLGATGGLPARGDTPTPDATLGPVAPHHSTPRLPRPGVAAGRHTWKSIDALPIIAASLIISLAAPAAGQVQGRLRRVGLFEGGAPLARPGTWTFAEIELKSLEPKPFDGELRIQQRDRDGDVIVAVQEVYLAPGEDWRSYEVYFTPNRGAVGGGEVSVRLFDAEGVLVRVRSDAGEELDELTSDPWMDIPAEEFLIVDLSIPRKLPHLTWLDPRRQPRGATINLRTVRLLAPQALPSKWHGLEAVDAIVWDDVDPTLLAEQQLTALVEWVRHGGRLLLTSSRNWQALMNSPLAEVLPVKITDVRRMNELQAFTEVIVPNDDYSTDLAQQYARKGVAVCKMQRLGKAPEVVSIPADYTGVDPVAHRRFLGRGCLTFVGASLHELMPPPERLEDMTEDAIASIAKEETAPPFVRYSEEIIGWNFLALPRAREPAGGLQMFSSDLFDTMRSTIWFQAVGAAFLVFAILFAAGYWLAATGGTWWYLRRRGWQHLCWSAFAIVSLAGILIGTGMVWTLRGVTTKLWQTTVVDGRAGDDYAYATCLFGVKTPDHTRLDLRLPAGDRKSGVDQQFGVLTAMPPSELSYYEEARFVAPDQYVSARAGAFLDNVPVRATLKELVGHWEGFLDGRLEARLVVDKDHMFGEGSYIRNNLGFPLKYCYILEDRAETSTGRALLTRCLELGELPPAEPGQDFDLEAFRLKLYYGPTKAGVSPTPIDNRQLGLGFRVAAWRKELPGGGVDVTGMSQPAPRRLSGRQEIASMLLLSVFNLIDLEDTGQELHRSFGRPLDCTHLLTRETAVLIGFAESRPPAILEVNGRNLYPEKALTMYRFVIPVERR